MVYSLLEMSNCFYSKLTVTIKQNLELRLHHSLHLLVKKLKALYQVLRLRAGFGAHRIYQTDCNDEPDVARTGVYLEAFRTVEQLATLLLLI